MASPRLTATESSHQSSVASNELLHRKTGQMM